MDLQNEHVKPPRQERSRERLERLLEATMKLLKRKRFDQITIQEIVEEAETSVGVFYSRFDSKQDLFLFLQEKVYADVAEIVGEEFNRKPPSNAAEAVERLVALILKLHSHFSGISREIVQQAWADKAQLDRGIKWNKEMADLIRPIFASYANGKIHKNKERAAEMALLIMIGAIREMVPGNFWPSKMRPSDKEIVREVSRSVLLYLTGKSK